MGWAKSIPFVSINPTNPRTNPWNFHEKILRIGGAGKRGFFEAAILNFLSRPFWFFFCFISVKNPALLYEVSFFSALWMVFPESWKRSCPNFYAHDCTLYVKLDCIPNVSPAVLCMIHHVRKLQQHKAKIIHPKYYKKRAKLQKLSVFPWLPNLSKESRNTRFRLIYLITLRI